jgi:hypothetical protein
MVGHSARISLVLVVLAASAAAGAARAESDRGSEPAAADAVAIAAKAGVSVGTAEQWLANQDAFDRLQESLELRFPTFGGAWTDWNPGPTYNVLFKGSGPAAETSDIAGQLGLTVTVHEGAAFSEAELEERAADLHRDLQDRGFTSVATAYSVGRQLVLANVHSPRTVLDGIPEYARGSGYQVTVSDAPITREEAYILGGSRLRKNSDPWCTSGFTVKVTGTTTRGVVTVGHCSAANKYVDHFSGGGVWNAPFQDKHVGTWGDLGWHTVSGVGLIAENSFWYTPYNTRPVTSIQAAANIDGGDYYCMFGRTSQQQLCDIVEHHNAGCGSLGHMVVTAMTETEGGDSGGPWYINSKAVGVHFGLCNPDGLHMRSTFSKADYVDNQLDVEILLQ